MICCYIAQRFIYHMKNNPTIIHLYNIAIMGDIPMVGHDYTWVTVYYSTYNGLSTGIVEPKK